MVCLLCENFTNGTSAHPISGLSVSSFCLKYSSINSNVKENYRTDLVFFMQGERDHYAKVLTQEGTLRVLSHAVLIIAAKVCCEDIHTSGGSRRREWMTTGVEIMDRLFAGRREKIVAPDRIGSIPL